MRIADFACSVLAFINSVMLKALGTARNAGLVLFCAVFLGETVTEVEVLGYAVALSAFVFYTKVSLDLAAEANKPARQSDVPPDLPRVVPGKSPLAERLLAAKGSG